MIDCPNPESPASATTLTITDILRWRSSYDGIMTIAEFDERAVAGISGPWSGKFALTWWEGAPTERTLDLFDTLGAAKRAVELWARRKSGLPLFDAEVTKPNGILGFLLPNFARANMRPDPVATIERLRRSRIDVDVDLGELHFRAID